MFHLQYPVTPSRRHTAGGASQAESGSRPRARQKAVSRSSARCRRSRRGACAGARSAASAPSASANASARSTAQVSSASARLSLGSESEDSPDSLSPTVLAKLIHFSRFIFYAALIKNIWEIHDSRDRLRVTLTASMTYQSRIFIES